MFKIGFLYFSERPAPSAVGCHNTYRSSFLGTSFWVAQSEGLCSISCSGSCLLALCRASRIWECKEITLQSALWGRNSSSSSSFTSLLYLVSIWAVPIFTYLTASKWQGHASCQSPHARTSSTLQLVSGCWWWLPDYGLSPAFFFFELCFFR